VSDAADSIPSGWARATLDELGDWYGGGTPSKKVPGFWDGDIPWVSPKDMKALKLDDAQDHITEAAVAESAAKLFRANSLAFVVRSGILEHTLPIALVRRSATVNQDIKVLTPDPKLNPEWLLYTLLALAPTIRHECQKDGTTVASIDFPQLKTYPILVPPRAEQDRIVAAVESAMAAVDEAEVSLRRTAAHVSAFRESCRTAAFKFDGAPVVYLHEVAETQSGITKTRPKGSGLKVVPYIRTANVQAGYLDLKEIKELSVPEAKVARYALRSGDVLVLEGGDADKVGRGWIWENEVPGAIHQNHVFAVRPGRRLDPRFLAHYVNAPPARQYFLRVAKQTTNLASINKTQLKALPIPLPPLEAQRRAVTELEQRLGVAREIEKELASHERKSAELRRAVLHRAVTGQLVSQDPSDEPAPELLSVREATRE
jgi:type I restriction enzyme, S subunit